VGNFCVAPVTGDTRTGKLTFMNSYHYIGHFSKFIRPGAKRILCSSNSDDLLATAFVNPDGSVAAVVMNELERPTNLALWIDGTAAKTAVPAHSIVTLVVTP
jgi:glucosylceramidase